MLRIAMTIIMMIKENQGIWIYETVAMLVLLPTPRLRISKRVCGWLYIKERRRNRGTTRANKDTILGKGTREGNKNKRSHLSNLMEEEDVGNTNTNEQQEIKE